MVLTLTTLSLIKFWRSIMYRYGCAGVVTYNGDTMYDDL